MNVTIYLAIVISILNVCLLNECKGQDSNSIRLCGVELSEFVSQLCKNNFATVTKKSKYLPNLPNLPMYDFIKYTPNEIDNSDKALYPFSLKRIQYQFLNHRVKRQIADECCRGKACSSAELLGYCAF